MARLTRPLFVLDERGAVYVEFLVAFLPVFILFLGICQIALLSTARFVVQHAANRAARSAVVMLESSPADFGGVARGWVSTGTGPRQQGGRIAPIRLAAYMPLSVLAPPAAWLEPRGQQGSLGDALAVGMHSRAVAALPYNRAGAVVTLQAGPLVDELAPEPIGRKAPVTVRVTYLYYCSIPVVRAFGCKSIEELTGEKPSAPAGPFALTEHGSARTPPQKRLATILALAEDPMSLARLDVAGARFVVLTAETTLPNQGAGYY
ncbi:MAG TPA: TadE family protein [Polyangiaceae bacterium]|nr:TadE family protein [Polyangiaceae bacterium]